MNCDTTPTDTSLFELFPRVDFVPDLGTYDIILVSTSAGKDSQAMLDHVVELADAAGVRDRLVAVHADLGRVEWPGTPELAAEQAAHYGIRFEKVSRDPNKGDLLDHIAQRGLWPSAAYRYCTSDHKRAPIYKLMTRLVAELRDTMGDQPRQVRICNTMGLRRAESAARAKKEPLTFNDGASNGRRHVDDWLPILEWSDRAVWDRIAASGVRHHPAYDAGMPRLSCCFCVLASRSALTLAAQLNPELAAAYVAVEVRIGHRFTATTSIAEIVADARRHQPVTAATWAA